MEVVDGLIPRPGQPNRLPDGDGSASISLGQNATLHRASLLGLGGSRCQRPGELVLEGMRERLRVCSGQVRLQNITPCASGLRSIMQLTTVAGCSA